MSARQFLAEHTSEDITELMALNYIEHEQRAPQSVDAQLHAAFGKKRKP